MVRTGCQEGEKSDLAIVCLLTLFMPFVSEFILIGLLCCHKRFLALLLNTLCHTHISRANITKEALVRFRGVPRINDSSCPWPLTAVMISPFS